jgi:hypothetical protein
VGGGQSEIKAAETRGIEADDECRGTKENCGGATEEMGSRESEEERLNDNAATAGVWRKAWEVVRDHLLLLCLRVLHYSMIRASLLYARIAVF